MSEEKKPFPNPETQFKPGQSGNPSGRPKGAKDRSTVVRKWIETEEFRKNPITKEEAKHTQEDIITLAIIKKARGGDVKAYNALMDSLYGKARQLLEIESPSIDFVAKFDLSALTEEQLERYEQLIHEIKSLLGIGLGGRSLPGKSEEGP